MQCGNAVAPQREHHGQPGWISQSTSIGDGAAGRTEEGRMRTAAGAPWGGQAALERAGTGWGAAQWDKKREEGGRRMIAPHAQSLVFWRRVGAPGSGTPESDSGARHGRTADEGPRWGVRYQPRRQENCQCGRSSRTAEQGACAVAALAERAVNWVSEKEGVAPKPRADWEQRRWGLGGEWRLGHGRKHEGGGGGGRAGAKAQLGQCNFQLHVSFAQESLLPGVVVVEEKKDKLQYTELMSVSLESPAFHRPQPNARLISPLKILVRFEVEPFTAPNEFFFTFPWFLVASLNVYFYVAMPAAPISQIRCPSYLLKATALAQAPVPPGSAQHNRRWIRFIAGLSLQGSARLVPETNGASAVLLAVFACSRGADAVPPPSSQCEALVLRSMNRAELSMMRIKCAWQPVTTGSIAMGPTRPINYRNGSRLSRDRAFASGFATFFSVARVAPFSGNRGRRNPPLVYPCLNVAINALQLQLYTAAHQRPHRGIKIDCRTPPLEVRDRLRKVVRTKLLALFPTGTFPPFLAARAHPPSQWFPSSSCSTQCSRTRRYNRNSIRLRAPSFFNGPSAYAHWDSRSTRDRGFPHVFAILFVGSSQYTYSQGHRISGTTLEPANPTEDFIWRANLIYASALKPTAGSTPSARMVEDLGVALTCVGSA
ncbi:hypothetical protein FB451DRAFT_1446971 [Mycena latifolia]|nr:hypothetical protein FB451DRAFT_1446971 [Mycena latifolia]